MSDDPREFKLREKQIEVQEKQIEARTKREDAFHAECLKWMELLRAGMSTLGRHAIGVVRVMVYAHYMILLVAVVVPAAWSGQPVYGRSLAIGLGLPLLAVGAVGITAIIAMALIKRGRDTD